ncbi:MAG: glutaredoxin [Bacteroidetes bacterium]|nr:glutaredoxin [Bacteroidota bacterium]
MALFTEEVREKLTDVLKDLKEDIHLVYFTQEVECSTCQDGRSMIEEISALSDKIHHEVFEFEKNPEKAKELGVDKTPAIVVLDNNKGDKGIKFYGVPGGYEIGSFISALHEVSGNSQELSAELDERVKKVKKDIHIQVFTTMSCPHCPPAVATAHKLALENEHITAEMVDASTFPDLSNKYKVMGVPKIVINETHDLVGAQPITEFLKVIEQV